MEAEPNQKIVTLPCRKYFEDRLLFFIDCKYWSNKERSADTEEMIDRSVMRAAVEMKAYEFSLEMMKKEGLTVVIEDRKFNPGDLMPRVEELPDTPPSPEIEYNELTKKEIESTDVV